MKNRGIALLTTLIISTVLLVLLGAFIQLNRGHLSTLSNSRQRENCLRTIMSAHEYCVHKIERDKTWASVNFPADQADPDLAGFLTVNEMAGSTRLEGDIPSLKSTFTVEIDNQLATNERVVLLIEATSGGLTRKVESTMRPAPLFDSGVAAGGGINIDASEWTVGSRDPYRNLVRANDDILAPDYNDIHFVGKTNSAGNDGDDHGFLWSKSDISFFTGGSHQSVTDPLVMQDAMNATGARFIPNSGLNNPIHDLQVDDVVLPTDSSTIPAGDYQFTEAVATFERYEQTGTDAFGNAEYSWVSRTKSVPILGRYLGSLTDYWYTNTTMGGSVRNVSFGLPGTAHPQPAATFPLDGAGLVEATLDLPGHPPAFNIRADGAVRIPGTFGVTSTGDEPELIFSGTSGDAQIKAEGNITFDGSINGKGIIMSEQGNVELNVTNANTSGNQLGVSVFAHGDITMNSLGSGNFQFSGLLFARENVLINGVDRDFNVDGALIARNGNISINTTGKVDLTYNPDHLKVLLESLPDNRTKLENLIWKE